MKERNGEFIKSENMENSDYKKMEWTLGMADRLCQVLFPKYSIRRSRDYVWIKKDFLHVAAVGMFYSEFSKRHIPTMYKKRDIKGRTILSVTTYGRAEYSPIATLVLGMFRRIRYSVIDKTDGGFFEEVEDTISEFVRNPQKEIFEKMEALQDSPVGKF